MAKAHRKAKALGANQGGGRTVTNKLARTREIITQSPILAKQNRRPASPAQIRYLQALRPRVGLDEWNRIKSELGITTPGTYGLGVAEAGVLIETVLEVLRDGKK